MMNKFFSLSLTVTSIWVLIYFLPKFITQAAYRTHRSDCVICPRDAKTNKTLDLIALPLNLETLAKLRGYYDGATLTSAQEPFYKSPGKIYNDKKMPVITTTTMPGLAVSLGHASSIAGKAHLCFEAEAQLPYSSFMGRLNTTLLCNYTLIFNKSALKWDPDFNESELNERRADVEMIYTHDLTWDGETKNINDPVYFIKSSSRQLYLGIGLRTGTTFVWSDFFSLPQFNIIQLIFRNLFCASPLRTYDRKQLFYLPLCSDAYLLDDINRKFSDYQGFANIHNHTWFRALGYTTAVSLNGTGFFFLCGQSLYLQLPRFWHGSCTVVAILPDAIIYQPKDMKFMGSHTTLGSFLKAIPISCKNGNH